AQGPQDRPPGDRRRGSAGREGRRPHPQPRYAGGREGLTRGSAVTRIRGGGALAETEAGAALAAPGARAQGRREPLCPLCQRPLHHTINHWTPTVTVRFGGGTNSSTHDQHARLTLCSPAGHHASRAKPLPQRKEIAMPKGPLSKSALIQKI